MQKIFSIFFLIFLSVLSTVETDAQSVGSSNSTIQKSETFINLSDTLKYKNAISTEKTEALTYNREIPPPNTYKIIKNTSGLPISDSILEEINLHRKFDVDFTWVVNSNIEILIYYVGKPLIITPEINGK